MSKKWLSIFIVLAMLAATFGTVFARPALDTAPGTCNHTLTVRVGGKQGFYSTNPDFGCWVSATAIRGTAAPAPKGMKFLRPVLSLAKKTVQPTSAVFSGKTQVYFDLNKQQETAWKAGRIAIFYYNQTTKTWTKLRSYQAPISGSKFRLASNIYNFGMYGLVYTK